jgi:hypothetical protein
LRSRERQLAAGPVAQWLEPAAHNGLVPGSSPGRPTNKIKHFLNFGGWSEVYRLSYRHRKRCQFVRDLIQNGLPELALLPVLVN